MVNVYVIERRKYIGDEDGSITAVESEVDSVFDTEEALKKRMEEIISQMQEEPPKEPVLYWGLKFNLNTPGVIESHVVFADDVTSETKLFTDDIAIAV